MQRKEGEEPCDICGVEGWKDVIATCSMCKTSREHLYCMRIVRTDKPHNWVCEECVSNTGCAGREIGQDSSQKIHHNVVTQTGHTNVCNESVRTERQKAVKTGKTKFLSEEEVKKLLSGSIKESCSEHKIAGKASSPVTPTFCPSRVKPIPRMIHLGSRETPYHGKMQVSGTQQPRTFKEEKLPAREQQKPSVRESGWKGKQAIPIKPSNEVKIGKMNVATKEGKIFLATVDKTKNKACLHSSSAPRHKVAISERKACVSHTKDLSHDECNISLPVEEVKTASSYDQNVTKEAPPSSLCSPERNIDAVADPKNSGVEMCDLLDVLPELRLYRCFAPALQPVWNGYFNIKDFDTAVKFNEGFRAHPPMTVHRKAYEFSQKMPVVIQVKLLPRNHVWAHLFQNGDPQFDDIALYFFPADNDQRSKETFASLINLLETRESVLLSCMDGVELLILTFKQFDVKLQDVISGSGVDQCLWGIFLHGDYRIQNVIHEFSSLPAPRENSNNTNRSCGEHIDMEIDMVGGQELGNTPRKSTGENCKDSNKKVADQNALKEMVNTLIKGVVEETFQSFDASVVLPVTRENTSPPKMKAEKNALLQSCPIEVKRELQESGSGINPLTRWCPPPTDWVKLNVAGSSKGPTGFGGAGGVIRDHSGKWVVGYTMNVGTEKELRAVFWAVHEGLKLTWNKGYRKVILECESLVAIELLQKPSNVLGNDKGLIECCKEFLKLQWDCKVECICKDANLCANRLAASFGQFPMELIVLDTPPDANID